MHSRFVVVAMLVVGASLAAGVSAGASVGAASNGQPSIAFVSDRGGQQQLWTTGSDGSSPRLVASDAVSPFAQLSWTADGTRIAVNGGVGGYSVVNPDGSGRFTVSPAYAVSPSPDGTRIAYLSSVSGCSPPDGGCELVLARTDGSARVVLTPHSSGAVGWSPDGTQLAYEVRGVGSASEIWRAAADGSGAARLVTVPSGVGGSGIAWLADDRLVLVVGWEIAPHVFLYRPGDAAPTPLEPFAIGDGVRVERSPDGRRFALFASGAGSPQVIRAYDLSGTLTARASGGIRQPTWSPDGTSMVYGFCDFSFGQQPKGPCSVQLLDLAGGQARQLLPGPGEEPATIWYQGSSWAPDGNRLAVSSLAESGKLQIEVVTTDGATVTSITDGAANDTQPAWQPKVPPPSPVHEFAPNPGFESDPAGSWSGVHQGGGQASFAWTTATVHGGTHALAITSTRSSTSFSRWITSGRIPVRPGQATRFEAWLKATGIVGSGRTDVTFFDRDGVYIPGSAASSAETGQLLTGSQDWTKLVVDGSAPSRARSIRLEIRLYGTGTLYADDASLTVG